jgi:hypothetical protein
MAAAKPNPEPDLPAPRHQTPKRARKRASAARFATLAPEHFSPFAERDLIALTARLIAEPAPRRSTLLTQSEIGASLVNICGDDTAVIEHLQLVWSPVGHAARDLAAISKVKH